MQKRIEEIRHLIDDLIVQDYGEIHQVDRDTACAVKIAALYDPKPDESRLLTGEDLDKLAKENPILDFSFEDDYREEVTIMRETQDLKTARIVAEEIFEEIEGELNIEYLIRAKGGDISSMSIIGKLKNKVQALKAKYMKGETDKE